MTDHTRRWLHGRRVHPGRRGTGAVGGPFGGEAASPVQPYAARKRYVCPGCDGWIAIGEGHLVIVPELAPDLRRHWHRACWDRELRRRHGRAGRATRPRD